MKNKIILFSTGCPKCNVLKQKLTLSNIEYEESDNLQEIIDKGFLSVPVLKIDERYLNFKEANDWINSRGN